MRIITRQKLIAFWNRYPNAQQALKAWEKETEHANWTSPDEIKVRYPSASILPDNRIVFNIQGNNYRLVVKIHYNTGVVFIRFIGTHKEYDRINAENI